MSVHGTSDQTVVVGNGKQVEYSFKGLLCGYYTKRSEQYFAQFHFLCPRVAFYMWSLCWPGAGNTASTKFKNSLV